MNVLFIYLMILMFLVIIMMISMMKISKKSILDSQKLSPFECGFNPMSNKRLPFSISFFMIAIIFLIFDIEIIIIMPSIFTMKYSITKFWSYTSMTFIFIILMSLYYEWWNGLLNWEK